MPFISDLDPTYPDGQIHRGYIIDDDLRSIKTHLQDSFPAINAAVTASPAELNTMVGATANIQAQIDAIEANIIPQGTLTSFVQSAAPTSWTHDVSFNDRYFRAVSGGTGGTSGGDHVITGLTLPHTHAGITGTDIEAPERTGFDGIPQDVSRDNHTHPFTTDQPSSDAVISDGTWRLAYYDVIVCSKNAYTVP